MKMRRLGTWVLSVGLGLVQPSLTWAQGGTGVATGLVTGVASSLLSNAESEALEAFRAQRYIRAREQSESLLKADPQNMIGMWVLGGVFLFGEGRQERARYYIDRAAVAFRDRFQANKDSSELRELYREIKQLQIEVYGQLEAHKERLALIDAFEAEFDKSQEGNRIWSLMALGRYEEAQELALPLTMSSDLYDRIQGYNTMIVLHDYRSDIQATEQAVQEGIKSLGEQSCIILHNGAQIALILQLPDLAIERARKAMRAGSQDCPFSSYGHLTTAYLFKGEFMRALSAFKALRRQPLRPDQIAMFNNSIKVELVQMLLLMGKGEEALEHAKVLYTQPARLAMTSLKPNEDAVRATLLYWLALELSKRSAQERWATRPFFEGLEQWALVADYVSRQWELERRLIQLVSEPNLLEKMQRHYLREMQPWFVGRFASLLGYGIASAGLTGAQSQDSHEVERLAPYYQSVRGEYAYHTGDYERAIELGSAAFKALSKDLLTLRHRTAAYVAGAYYRLGQAHTEGAKGMYREALQNLPSALRELDIPIPVRIDYDGPEWIKESATLLNKSPRVSLVEGAPFVLTVRGADTHGEVCLSTSEGFRFQCVSYPGEDDPKEESTEARQKGLVEAFHQRLFTPLVDMTSRDIHSLDGSPVRIGADEVLGDMLGTAKPKDKKAP